MRITQTLNACPRPVSRLPLGGFTMTELLVVIVVVAMLTGMWVPGQAKAKSKSQGVVCLNNLNQMVRATHMYATDYRDYLWPNPDDGQDANNHSWCAGNASLNYPNGATGGSAAFNPDGLRNPRRALLAPYLEADIDVYRCPADKYIGRYTGTDPNLTGKMVPHTRSISASGCVGVKSDGASTIEGPWLDGSHGHIANSTWYCYGKMSDFNRPGASSTFIFVDEDPFSINDAAFATVGPKSPPLYPMLDWPATSHNMAGAFAFADGHSEMHKWLDPRTQLKGAAGAPTQPGNQDIWWMSTHSTARVDGTTF